MRMSLKEYDRAFCNRCDAYFRQQVLDIIEDLNYNELQTLLEYLKVMPRRKLEDKSPRYLSRETCAV